MSIIRLTGYVFTFYVFYQFELTVPVQEFGRKKNFKLVRDVANFTAFPIVPLVSIMRD